MGGAVAGVALWTVSSFFNGIGRTRVTLVMMLCVAVANAVLNQMFIFGLGLGVAGVAWATTAAQVLGFALGLAVFLSRPMRAECQSQRGWRPTRPSDAQSSRAGSADGVAARRPT